MVQDVSHLSLSCNPNLFDASVLLIIQLTKSSRLGQLFMQPIRQGDVILLPAPQIEGEKLSHLTLAEGEVTGHKHRISDGKAELYEKDGILYLRVFSDTATLTHEEHNAISVPQGNWVVRIQREYEPQSWRYVAD
jgi:hypothetical protein